MKTKTYPTLSGAEFRCREYTLDRHGFPPFTGYYCISYEETPILVVHGRKEGELILDTIKGAFRMGYFYGASDQLDEDIEKMQVLKR